MEHGPSISIVRQKAAERCPKTVRTSMHHTLDRSNRNGMKEGQSTTFADLPLVVQSLPPHLN